MAPFEAPAAGVRQAMEVDGAFDFAGRQPYKRGFGR